MSAVRGSSIPSLYDGTIRTLVKQQSLKFNRRVAVIDRAHNIRLTFKDLDEKSKVVATALLKHGIRGGEVIAIMAGNRYEYIETFLAAASIGISIAVMNNTYTSFELVNALQRIPCKALFIATSIGANQLHDHIEAVQVKMGRNNGIPSLKHLVVFGHSHKTGINSYSSFIDSKGSTDSIDDAASQVSAGDMVNLQFTSGTTGIPKAAMLTHRNIINNGKFVGDRMGLTEEDIVCCPPPLFHAFGLVMGFISSLSHGSAIVFPADTFNAKATLEAVTQEQCTAILGVPTMFIAELDAFDPLKDQKSQFRIRTGLAAGSVVPPSLLKRLRDELGWVGILNAYGMTETSPITFMMSMDDPTDRLSRGLGTVMPHTCAKVVDKYGKVVPRGCRGELWTSGYCVMTGYFNNEQGTRDTLSVDKDGSGCVWMKTGDECVIDEEGFCEITGRIKDIIIRGGENIFPSEIEDLLLEHNEISEASVVGLSDFRLGEVVGCFLRQSKGGQTNRPSLEEVQEWIKCKLGRHKAPTWVFWIGEPGVGHDYPKTGSGKHQKHILRDIGNRLVKERVSYKAKL